MTPGVLTNLLVALLLVTSFNCSKTSPLQRIVFNFGEEWKFFPGDAENVIAVKVNNPEQPNSRWYSGSGIYRNVWLVKTAKLHADHWGTFVTTPEVNVQLAKVSEETTVANKLASGADAILKTSLFYPAAKRVAQIQSSQRIGAGAQNVFRQNLEVEKPELWDIENPALYKSVSEVYNGNVLVDTYETTFGMRYFNFDTDEGFSLNGRNVKLLGVCQNHDLGALGAAINTRALERQSGILKEVDCNFIRTAHNPPAPELLQLCDKMGFVVQNETLDMWQKRKTTYDYSRFFPEWHEPFQACYPKAFHGKCHAIVKAPKSKENTIFKATSEGLASAEVKLTFK